MMNVKLSPDRLIARSSNSGRIFFGNTVTITKFCKSWNLTGFQNVNLDMSPSFPDHKAIFRAIIDNSTELSYFFGYMSSNLIYL